MAEDGPEWLTSKNMFPSYGYIDTSIVATGGGLYFKMEGATNVGTLGYGISPTSAENARGRDPAQTAGLKAGYVNANFPFGSTNVEPIALAMKSAGVNGPNLSVDPNTGFASITALRQSGDNPKVALLPTGYGGDLQQAGPAASRSRRMSPSSRCSNRSRCTRRRLNSSRARSRAPASPEIRPTPVRRVHLGGPARPRPAGRRMNPILPGSSRRSTACTASMPPGSSGAEPSHQSAERLRESTMRPEDQILGVDVPARPQCRPDLRDSVPGKTVSPSS